MEEKLQTELGSQLTIYREAQYFQNYQFISERNERKLKHSMISTVQQ